MPSEVANAGYDFGRRIRRTNYFSGKIEAFDIEMDNSGSELVDYFLKQSGRSAARK